MGVPSEIASVLEQLNGLECTRREIGWFHSLSLGFGPVSTEDRILPTREYREWELGTYYRSWRIGRERRILIGSSDATDSIKESNQLLAAVPLGKVVRLFQPNDLDIRIELSCGSYVDILATHCRDDETFHVFCPGRTAITFSIAKGWRMGPSDKPWGAEEPNASPNTPASTAARRDSSAGPARRA